MILTELPIGLAGGARTRPLELADLPTVHRLELELFPQDAWPIDMFLAEVQHPTRAYLVLEKPQEDGNYSIIGYAGCMTVGDTADVQTIAVIPSQEGYGYGRALLDFMSREAAARGAEQILLEVRADNPRAQRLYTRNGYEHIHTRPGYYGGGVDALIMRQDLTTSPKNQVDHD